MHMMVSDMWGTLAATCVLALFLAVPGYALGWFTNVLEFRSRATETRLLLAVALSYAVVPVLLRTVGDFVGLGVAWALVISTWAWSTWHIVASSRHGGWLATWGRRDVPLLLGVVFCAAWVIIGTGMVVDIQYGQNLVPVPSGDYWKHFLVTSAIANTGVPPSNPVYYPGAPVSLFYYYAWHIVPASIVRLSGGILNVRVACYGSMIWSGLALVGSVELYVRFMAAESGQRAAGRRCLRC